MELPRHYNKILQKTYPDCRIRWSVMKECWLLERKANYARVDIDPSKYPEHALDTFIQRRDGYYTAGAYHPQRLLPVDFLVQILLANDTARMEVPGATPEEQAANYCDMMEERERAFNAKLVKDQTFKESGAGADLYDQLAWEEKRRVAVPSKYAFGSGKAK